MTGGAGGIGAATAERLRADGLGVVTLDLAGADVSADVTDEQALRRVAGEVGPVDVLVNSAGIVGPNRPLVQTTADEWRHVLDVDVVGTVNTVRAFVPGMAERGWGRVVNLASTAGKDGNPGARGLLGRQGGGHRADQVRGRGAGHHRRPGQRTSPAHPDGAGRPARGGRRAGRLPVLRPGQLLHRCRLRHQRRPRHLLSSHRH